MIISDQSDVHLFEERCSPRVVDGTVCSSDSLVHSNDGCPTDVRPVRVAQTELPRPGPSCCLLASDDLRSAHISAACCTAKCSVLVAKINTTTDEIRQTSGWRKKCFASVLAFRPKSTPSQRAQNC